MMSNSDSTHEIPEGLAEFLQPGALFEGKYRILEHLGSGSFAIVVHARHEVMERDVALKFLKPQVTLSNPDVSQRFIKEVQLVSRLRHQNTVTIFDFGQTQSGIHYMVMEHVNGVTLEDVLEQQGAVDELRAIRICDQLLDSLKDAHSHHIVHRDLKPANIMLCTINGQDEQIKILDFGVAKLLEPHERENNSQRVRQSTQFIGTPLYMSPEQILGEEIVPASDYYSVGLILYELLTGEPPIEARNFAEVTTLHLDEKPLPFRSINRLDAGLQSIILQATSRFVRDRFQTAETFQNALQQYRSAYEASSLSSTLPEPPDIDLLATVPTGTNSPGGLDGLAHDDETIDMDQENPFQSTDVQEVHASATTSAPDLKQSVSNTKQGQDEIDDIFLGKGYYDLMGFGEDDAVDEAPIGLLQPDSARSVPQGLGEPISPQGSDAALQTPLSSPKENAPGFKGHFEKVDAPRVAVKPTSKAAARHAVPMAHDDAEIELDLQVLRPKSKRKASKASPVPMSGRALNAKDIAKFEASLPFGDSLVRGFVSLLQTCALLYLVFVVLTASFGAIAAPSRAAIGLLPFIGAVIWTAVKGRLPRTFSIVQQWLLPISFYYARVSTVVLLAVLLLIPENTAKGLREDSTWFFTTLPDTSFFNTLERATFALSGILAKLFEAVATILPW